MQINLVGCCFNLLKQHPTSCYFLVAQSELISFPADADPKALGHKIAHCFIEGKHALHAGKWISYSETFYWMGAVNYAI